MAWARCFHGGSVLSLEAIAVVGLSLHAFGMWDKHRLEARGEAENPQWVVALYWMCWLLLVAVMAMLLFWRL